MTYDAADLHGAWEDLDNEGIITLNADGDFRLTPANDSPMSTEQVNVVGDIRGKWEVNDSKLKLSVDPRSVKLSSPSRLTRLGLAAFSFLLRFAHERVIMDDEITRLTDTDLWLERSDGTVTKLRKELRCWDAAPCRREPGIPGSWRAPGPAP